MSLRNQIVVTKRYDRAYFDRWYRRRNSRIRSGAELGRQVRLVVGMAEYLLDRPLRSALDVGCGEAAWQPALRRLRPGLRYQGVDSSAYVVRRFGRSRNVRRGSLAELDRVELVGDFDLIVCSDVLHYVPAGELARGLSHVRELLRGVAYLPVFTTVDGFGGDMRGFYARTPGEYRRLFRRAGLLPCGMQCYVPPELHAEISALERVA